MIAGLFVAAALTWQTPSGYAPPETGDWRVFSREGGSGAAMDVASIVREGSLRSVWIVRVEASQDDPPGGYGVAHVELDCDRAAARVAWFGVHDASGAAMMARPLGETLEPYTADGGAAAIAAIVCDGQPPAGPGFPTHQGFAASITRAS